MAQIKDREVIFSENPHKSIRFPLDQFPSECPQCHKGISVTPYFLEANIVNATNDYKKTSNPIPPVEIIFRCPSCYKLFIAIYKKKYEGNRNFFLIKA